MKRSGLSAISLVLLAILFTQCQQDVLIDFEDFKPKLVVNAQFTSAESFAVSIAQSVSPVSSEAGKIPTDLSVHLRDLTLDLEISLYRENDVFIAPQLYPRPGHTYQISASAGDLVPVTAETTIPKYRDLRAIDLQNVSVVASEATEGKNNVSYDMLLNFDNEHGQYLHLSFWQLTQLNVGTVDDPDFEQFIYAIEPEFPEEDGFRKHHEQGVLVDRLTLDSPENLTFSFRDYTINQFEELGDLLVSVRTTCPDYFRYFDSLARQLVSREDPLAEPIPTYNNVDGGLGNFSSFDSKVYRVQLFR